MEFRRRKRRRRAARATSGTGKAVLALVIIALAVYLVSASAAGTWIAKNVIAPVFAAFDSLAKDVNAKTPSDTGTDNSAASGSASQGDSQAKTVTEEVTVPAMDCFALQMGVFTTEQNAQAEADTLRQRGAGGYILNDGGRYRVLAAVYSDKASLDQVREQLKAEGMDSAAYTFNAPVSTLRITATSAQLTRIKDGIAALGRVRTEMGDATLAFDKDKQAVADGLSKAAVLKQELSEAKTAFLAGDTEGNAVLSAVAACFSSYEDALTALAAYQTNSFVDFSSKMKYTHLYITSAYATLAQQVSASAT